MCSIAFLKTERLSRADIERYNTLIRGLLHRGQHAIGFYEYYSNALIKTHSASSYAQVIKETLESYIDRPVALLFHSRYSTSGGFENDANNMPIKIKGGAIVVNGVITMDADDLKGLDTENDAEILLRKIMGQDEYLIPEASAYAYIAITDSAVEYASNGKRPLYHTLTGGSTWVYSTFYAGKRAGLTPKVTEGVHNVKLS